MFSVLHPALLWGVAAVGVPVLIHLLLRQRPRPRPWAAMRWLLAAVEKAQRRYRLTNLLLLLLRCLIVALLALAVARPSLAGLGQGGRLVLVIDTTASMGARGTDPGPLAQAKAILGRAVLPDRVAVVAVGEGVRVVADRDAQEALAAIDRLVAEPLPGGLDRAAAAGNSERVLAVCGAEADVVLISDFQQDDGELLAALLDGKRGGHARSLARCVVGAPAANAVVTGLGPMPDLIAGQPGELVIHRLGPVDGAAIAVDGGPTTPVHVSGGGDALHLITPPLDLGVHALAIELKDAGLTYDNLLELPLRVRPAVATLSIQDGIDYLGAALAADSQQLDNHVYRPAQVASVPLPAQGLVALRGRVGDGERLLAWVRAGGVLWAELGLLREDPFLKQAVAAITAGDGASAGGPFASGDKDIDDVLGLGSMDQVPATALPEGAEILLRAGQAPLVAALPCARGWVVVELAVLAQQPEFEARGTTPLWVRRVARRFTARLEEPRTWKAGAPAPESCRLRRGGLVQQVEAGQPLLVAPGQWRLETDDATAPADHATSAVIVLPAASEGQIDKRPPAGTVSDLAAALPKRAGADWGLALLIAGLLAVIGEGLFAAWAGRTYGR